MWSSRRPRPCGSARGPHRRCSPASRPRSCTRGSRRGASRLRASLAACRPPTRSSSSASLGRERVGDVAEVDATHELLGAHVHEQLPQRLALRLGPQVPDRVDQRRGGHVDHALLGAEPAQLRVAGELAPERRAGRPRGRQTAADGPAAPAHGSPRRTISVPRPMVNVRPWPLSSESVRQNHVRRGVVGRFVHRVRAGQRARRGEADVADIDVGDHAVTHNSLPYPLLAFAETRLRGRFPFRAAPGKGSALCLAAATSGRPCPGKRAKPPNGRSFSSNATSRA